ncbi:MAG TPA: prephenate dehydratase [Methanobacterium sp.]|nr:prephenate dehydratase [Methanobacterium sp.]
MKIGYFGPPGTFTEEAALTISGEHLALNTINEVLMAVKNGQVDCGVVPIENSIEGSVGVTLDLLTHDYDLKIRREIILPISHNLLINPDAEIEDIKVIYSHSQALSQCRKFTEEMDVEVHSATSTSKAAELIRGNNTYAAIGTRRAAELLNLKIKSQNIQDYKNNLTRFVVISQKDHEKTGNDKTSLVFSLHEDRPGGLYKILGIFAEENINLTKIESRPSKEKLGRYRFYIDFEGHRKDDLIRNILNNIKPKVRSLKIIGSYPKEGDD